MRIPVLLAFSCETSQRASASVLIIANPVRLAALIKNVPIVYYVAEVSVAIIKAHRPGVSLDHVAKHIFLIFLKTISRLGEFKIQFTEVKVSLKRGCCSFEVL